MLYSASSRRAIIRRQQSSKRSLHIDVSRNSAAKSVRPLSALTLARPTTANNFRSRRPSTPYKSKNDDRIKELETIFLLTEQELYDFYRVYCFMAKEKNVTPSQQARKSDKRLSSSHEPSTPSGMTIELDTSHSNPKRPWEDKKRKVSLSLKDFFATFNLPNGGFYDAIFELVGIKDFHSMTFR